MKKRIIAGVFVAMIVVLVVWLELRNRVPFNSVVEIDISGPIWEQSPAGDSSQGATNSGSDGVSVHEVLTAIDAARDDKHVGGLVVRVGDANGRPAALKEIAAHISAFRKAGKASICFYDAEDDDVRAETLASACEKKVGDGTGNDDDIEEFFDKRFGEDNWYPIQLGEYLKKVRAGG